MSKERTVFEGWLDQTPGWEFDMPVYMVHPIGMYTEAGNASGIDQSLTSGGKLSRWAAKRRKAKRKMAQASRRRNRG